MSDQALLELSLIVTLVGIAAVSMVAALDPTVNKHLAELLLQLR